MSSFGATTLGLVVVVMYLAYRANCDHTGLNMPAFTVVMIAFVLLTVRNTFALFRAFPRPPQRSE
jgi:hypothetical protein